MTPSNNNTLRENMIRIATGTAFILLVPLVAMQFTTEVNWSFFDFVIIGILLLGSGTVYELVARKTGNRVVVGIIVTIVMMLIWAELAVGVFGSPFAGS